MTDTYQKEIDRITDLFMDILVVNKITELFPKVLQERPELASLFQHVSVNHFQTLNAPDWFHDEYVVLNIANRLIEKYVPEANKATKAE